MWRISDMWRILDFLLYILYFTEVIVMCLCDLNKKTCLFSQGGSGLCQPEKAGYRDQNTAEQCSSVCQTNSTMAEAYRRL